MTFRRKKSGKVVVSKRRGASKVPLTAGQQRVRDRFRLGAVYAKAAMQDPALKEIYTNAAVPDVSPYNMALKDACKSPKVESVDASAYLGKPGNSILVQAVDNFKVTAVKVSIRKEDGSLLEEGQAVLQTSGVEWLYTATVETDSTTGFTITAIAKGLPGNTGTLEIKL